MLRGAVLAGGGATRFDGKPKGLERVGGERMLDRVARAVAEAVGAPPLLVANAPNASTWRPDLHVTADRLPDQGSIGGIYTAVTAGDGSVLVVAWDMPFVTPGLLKALAQGSADYDVFLPESGGRRGVEPLCGIYGPACGQAIREGLERGDRRAMGFHDAVRVGVLPRAEVARYGDADLVFFNVTTADDLKRAEELWAARA
jgi:molybdopterin-guanine dinucleotide biosynthesis protein A